MADKNVGSFYKSYAEAIKSFPELSQKLKEAQGNPQKEEEIIEENSRLSRQCFLDDEKLLGQYIYPLLSAPEKAGDDLDSYLNGGSFLISDTHAIDMVVEYDLSKALLKYQRENGAPKEEIIHTLMLLQSAAGHFLTPFKTKEAAAYAEEAAQHTEVFTDNPQAYKDPSRLRLWVLSAIFNAFFYAADYQHVANLHDAVAFEKDLSLFLSRMEAIEPHLSEQEKQAFAIRKEIAYITVGDEFMALEKRLTWDREAQRLSPDEIKARNGMMEAALHYLEDLVRGQEMKNCLNEYSHILFFQSSLGLLSIEDYCGKLEEIYSWRQQSGEKKDLYTSDQFFYQMIISVDLSYALRRNPSVSMSEAADRIFSYFQESVAYLKAAPAPFFNTEMMKVTFDYLTDILPLLKDDGTLVSLIGNLISFRQPASGIHNRLVKDIALALAEETWRQHPEALVLPGQLKNAEDVLANKKTVMDFVANAAILHDTGKVPYWDIVNLMRRKITPDELYAVRYHVRAGYDLLRSNPALIKYADVALFHHKWYDGTEGYPEEEDSTHSPYRFYIDLISLADTIDAATDNLGRSYAVPKTLKELIKELVSQAGTRYNPLLVQMLAINPSLQKKIAYLTTEGRKKATLEEYAKYL
jgi:HD-GYP domain-containing protein (c-di-GMP phosphodiesterase class II)